MTMQTLQSTRTQAQVARTREAGMVVIIRGVPPDWAVPIGEALLAADVDVMEITLNTPQALEMIAALRAALGEQMVIGAGTVLSVEDAEHALAAGAEFFVSPHLDTDIVAFANERDCMVVPGAFTPTEVFTALRAGASIVKVFPANIVGPQFFKDLQGSVRSDTPAADRWNYGRERRYLYSSWRAGVGRRRRIVGLAKP